MLHRMPLAALGLLIALIVTPAVAKPGDALDRITTAGVVKVAVPDNFPPFGNLESGTTLEGYDIDTAGLIAKGLGVKLELVPVSSTQRIPALTSGKVDLVISSFGKDAEREKVVDFSVAYAPFYSAVFGPDRVAVGKAEDLAGKTIAVTRDTIEDTALTKLAPATATIKRYPDNAGTEVAYISNETQLVATGNVVAAELFVQNPLKKTAIKFLLRNSPCHIGVKKGEVDLLARVDAIIAGALKDGSLDRIAKHWLKTPLGNPEHPEMASVK